MADLEPDPGGFAIQFHEFRLQDYHKLRILHFGCHQESETPQCNRAGRKDPESLEIGVMVFCPPETGKSILPHPAKAVLFDGLLPASECGLIFSRIREEVQWQSREIVLFGKKIMQPRLVAWQGDPGCAYRYSGVTWNPDPWSPEVQKIRELVSRVTGSFFNGVLLNLYRDGSDSMGWHSDDEPELGEEPVIASVSLGEPRRFLFRKIGNPEEKVETLLQDGSLLVMSGQAQQLWQHSLPKSARVKDPRINLTFRKIDPHS
jgi:alkylated DNA repair dioxygenase AlkB